METKNTVKLGFCAAVLTTLLTIITWGIAIATPPLSGPYCSSGCYAYPYGDIAARFPRDYIWMYAAILLSLVYYILMTSIYYFAPTEKKIFSHIGLSFALLATATLVIDYFLQVSVIQPSLLRGEIDGIALLSQFNAHGVFIALEEIGFFMMSFSMLFMASVFAGRTKSEKVVRWSFILCFVLSIISFTLYSIFYGIYREYRFEIAIISINWLTLIVSGIPLSIVFRRALVEASDKQNAPLTTQTASA